ncbi:MAG TPA: hypothetical protein VIC60_07695 [Thermomicrobiales bacterium]
MDDLSHRTRRDKQLAHQRRDGTLRRIALIVAFASIWLTLPLLSVQAAPIGGTLTGKVVMKTAGASLPATPLTVTILFFNPGLFRVTDEAADFRTTTTAPDGSFTFAGLDNSAAGVYRVLVQYKGVNYEPAEQNVTDPLSGTTKSRAVRFANNATTATTEVPIYEPVVSTSPTAFTITSDQIIMNEVRPQFYSTLEAYQFSNPGDRTLVGALNPDGSVAQGVSIVFSTPANAQTITTNRIDLIPGADLTGQKLTLRMAIPPGASDITATYDMPGSPSGFNFVRTLDYAATKLQVLVSDSRQALNSQTLHNDGPIQAPQGATPFRQFSADNVQAGQTYDMLIGPSPATSSTATTTPATKSTWQRIRDRATVPFLLALALICLVLIFFVLRAPPRAPAGGGTPDTGNEDASPPTDTDDAVATPVAASSGARAVRRSRGRPHDYDVDDAERAIEEANQPESDEPSTERS